MNDLPGAFGTGAGLSLRLGQTVFSSASLLFMCFNVQFYSFTSFCYLVTIMGLVIPWSITLALVDAYSIFIKFLPCQRRFISTLVIGDWVLSFLSLAAACSTASVTNILLDVGGSIFSSKLCARYQLSAAMSFLSWCMSFASSLFNLWLLPSL